MFESYEEFQKRIGHVEYGRGFALKSRSEVLLAFVISVVLVAVAPLLALWLAWPDWLKACIGLALFAAYCVVAYHVRPHPNHDEIGAAGGLIDNPLRRSDNRNRSLVNLVALLAIGRYVSTGLVDGVRLLKLGELPQDRYMRELETEHADPP
jgi:hypothetical protein